MPTLVFQALMAVVDLAVLRFLRARHARGALLRGGAVFAAALLVLALLGEAYALVFTLHGPLFALAGFLAWGIFLHGPLLLAGAAATRWHEARTVAWLLLLVALADVLFAVYAFGIEPRWLEVTRYEVVSAKVPRRVRIAVLADLQTDRIGAYEERVLRAVRGLAPDMILLPGDYLHTGSEAEFRELRARLNALLRQEALEAPLGVYAVRGNVDHQEWERIFEGLPVQTFPSSGHVEVQGLHVTALSLSDSFRPDLPVGARPGFHIVFGHGPDFALGDVQADLLVAGHTHGGQVRLPWLGPLVTLSRIPRDWAAGRTELSGGRTLIVSRGVGMERGFAPRLRFLCRPELSVIELVPAGG